MNARPSLWNYRSPLQTLSTTATARNGQTTLTNLIKRRLVNNLLCSCEHALPDHPDEGPCTYPLCRCPCYLVVKGDAMARTVVENVECNFCHEPITDPDIIVEVRMFPDTPGYPRFRVDFHEPCYDKLTTGGEELKRGRPKGGGGKK